MERDSKPVIKIRGQNNPVESKLGNHGLLKQQQEYSADAHRRLSDADYIQLLQGACRRLSDDIGQLQQGTVMAFLLYNLSLPL